MTSSQMAWLALDIGSKSHTWASDINGRIKTGSVANKPAELETFLKGILSRCKHLRVLVEATGVYYLDVAMLASELGAEVMVVNPRVAHHFAEALNQRNKTDKLDTKMLLECLKRMPFKAWQPPAKHLTQLRDMGRFLVQLTDDGVAARNRLHALSSRQSSPAFVLTELKRMITSNDKRIARVRAKAIEVIQADSYLKERFQALDSIGGIAQVSAVSILSELATMPSTLSSRACVCHAGLDPRIYESGTSVQKAPRISRRGNKYLRRALFYPAMAAARSDPGAQAFKERLVGRGKTKMQANVAVMRKTLTVAWAMMKNPQPYDHTRLYCEQKTA